MTGSGTMRARPLAILTALSLSWGGAVEAQSQCDITYEAKAGDTVRTIAEALYQNREHWALIYYANQSVIGSDPTALAPGMTLFIPCIKGAAQPEATPLLDQSAELRFITGGAYPPFTDRDWPGEGMITELVNAVMEETQNPVSYAIDWEDDWSKHLFPILDETKADMGFPWAKPDCKADPTNERCVSFHFSNPLFVLPIQLFVRLDAGFVFNEDSDIEGKTLCRPKGYTTNDLDANGRNWLKDGKITLVQLETPDDCFRAVDAGEVDALAENLFLGADRIVALGLRGKVGPMERPLSTETLHVIVSKKHWRGTTFLFRINAGLDAIKANGRYEAIVNKHLAHFMDKLKP
jgi:polar amino acid transport system substrate-binding protein